MCCIMERRDGALSGSFRNLLSGFYIESANPPVQSTPPLSDTQSQNVPILIFYLVPPEFGSETRK